MALFGRQRDIDLFTTIARELVGEVTLNQSDLITAATAEKTALLERLRTYLGETSRTKLLERKSQEAEYLQKDLSSVPYTIYIG